MTIPADSLTDDNILFEWLFKVHSEMDAFMNKEEFAIRVLSTPVPVGEGTGTSAAVGHHMFMGRILGIGAPSPHEKYLDDPCELATSDDALATHLISLHTRFKFFKLSTTQPINVGDVIFGRLEPDNGEEEGTYNLQFARLDRLDFKAAISQNSQPTECSSLSSLSYTMPMGQFPTVSMPVASGATTAAASITPGVSGATGNLHNVAESKKDEVHVIYWYAGVAGGTKSFVEGQIRNGVTLKDNQLIVVGEHNYSVETMEESANTILQENGWTKKSESVGGWSAGGGGLARHLAKYPVSNFVKVEVADPVTAALLGIKFGANTTMYYRVNNWSTSYATIREQLPQLAAKIRADGGTAIEITDPTTGSHEAINLKQLQNIAS